MSTSTISTITSLEKYNWSQTSLADFTVFDLTGSGGMGIVFAVVCTKANHPQPNGRYALKVMLNYGVGDSRFSSFCRAEWENEFAILQRHGQHDRICGFEHQFRSAMPDHWL